jgi:hypothetical protein
MIDATAIAEKFTRHGGAYDRGSADAYYGRPFEPHYYVGDTYSTQRVTITDDTSLEFRDYMLGYSECTIRKDYS